MAFEDNGTGFNGDTHSALQMKPLTSKVAAVRGQFFLFSPQLEGWQVVKTCSKISHTALKSS